MERADQSKHVYLLTTSPSNSSANLTDEEDVDLSDTNEYSPSSSLPHINQTLTSKAATGISLMMMNRFTGVSMETPFPKECEGDDTLNDAIDIGTEKKSFNSLKNPKQSFIDKHSKVWLVLYG